MGLGLHPSARLTAAQLAAVAALISDCARPTAETALLTAMRKGDDSIYMRFTSYLRA